MGKIVGNQREKTGQSPFRLKIRKTHSLKYPSAASGYQHLLVGRRAIGIGDSPNAGEGRTQAPPEGSHFAFLAQEMQILFQGIAALWPEGFSESEGFLLEDTQSFDLMPQKRISVRTKQSCKVY